MSRSHLRRASCAWRVSSASILITFVLGCQGPDAGPAGSGGRSGDGRGDGAAPASGGSSSGGASGAGTPASGGAGGQPGGGPSGGPGVTGGTGGGGRSDAGSAPAQDASSESAPHSASGCTVDPARMIADVRVLASPELRGRKPGDQGNVKAIEYAEREFRAAGLVPAGDGGSFRQAFAFSSQGTAHNVLGKIVGTDPTLGKEVVVIGAHIDHLGVNADGRINYGADDNASGAALVMELARLFGQCGVKPKRTVLFVQFNAEEMGLIGSQHYVRAPTFPLANIVAMYNFDMVGAGDGSGALVFGGDDPRNAWMTELLRKAAAQTGVRHVIQTVRQKLASDHAPFVQKGIPSVFGFSRPDPHPGYHTPADDFANVRPASLKAVGELFWPAIRILTSGDEGSLITRPMPTFRLFTPGDAVPQLEPACSHAKGPSIQ